MTNSRAFITQIVFVIIILILSGCTAILAPLRVSDYCKSISGSENIKSSGAKACMDQEMSSQKKLSGMTIPWQVEKYCREISEKTGGSYQVMLTCVEEELKE
jgi:hypothetical protein